MTMIQKRATVTMLILLIAMCAFVIDVLSPATPTPIAQAAELLSILMFSLSFLGFVVRVLWYFAGQRFQPHPDSFDRKLGPRILIALNCSFLC
jgi:hypothetical protein